MIKDFSNEQILALYAYIKTAIANLRERGEIVPDWLMSDGLRLAAEMVNRGMAKDEVQE